MLARHRSRLLFGLAIFALVASNVHAEDEIDEEEPVPHSVKVESCAGWRLNKLPEVKKFITVRFKISFFDPKFQSWIIYNIIRHYFVKQNLYFISYRKTLKPFSKILSSKRSQENLPRWSFITNLVRRSKEWTFLI